VESSQGSEVEDGTGEEGEKAGKKVERCAMFEFIALQMMNISLGIAADSKNPEGSGSTEPKEKEVCSECHPLSLNPLPDLSSSFVRRSSFCWRLSRLQGSGQSVTPRRSLW